MSRVIEIVLFLAPFLGFAAWRLLFPSPLPPLWLMGGLGGFVVLMLAVLMWVWQLEAADGNRTYIPAQLRDGRIIPAHPATPP